MKFSLAYMGFKIPNKQLLELHPEPQSNDGELSYKDTYLHLTLTNSGIGGDDGLVISIHFGFQYISKSCFFVVKDSTIQDLGGIFTVVFV